MLAATKLPVPLKWIEDRRENLMSAGWSRHEHGDVRWPSTTHGLIQGVHIDFLSDAGSYPTPWPAMPATMVGTRLPRAVSRARGRLPVALGLHQHRRTFRLPRPVAVRDARAGGRARDRRPSHGHRPRRAATPQPAPARRDAVHERERHAVRLREPARDVRARGGDARLRGLPRGAGRGPARQADTSVSASRTTSNRPLRSSASSGPRGRRSASSPAARSTSTSPAAPAGTVSRRRWCSSPPTRWASTSTT